jgi:hypothetical protein
MEKLDLYKQFASEYAAKGSPAFVDIGPARYFGIEGQGEPGGEEFTVKLGALYNMAFTVKMASKFAGQDYAVSKLEGLWWTDALPEHFTDAPRDEWRWKLLIRIPEFVTEEKRKIALAELTRRGKGELVNEVVILPLSEGRCVQVLHLGPYSAEETTIAAMNAFASQNNYVPNGLHHEIYLSDPRRVDEAKLKTILRQPLKLKA